MKPKPLEEQARFICEEGARFTPSELISMAYFIIYDAKWLDHQAERLEELLDARGKSFLKTAAQEELQEMGPDIDSVTILAAAVGTGRPLAPGELDPGCIPRAFLESIAHW